MKKVVIGLTAVAAMLGLASESWASGIDNKPFWSAEYIRTLNRNASTDAVDSVAYNPAGTTKMADGGYVSLAVIDIEKIYSNTVLGGLFESDAPSYIPALYGLYKHDNWAAFLGINIVAGGGKVEFDQGNYSTNAIGAGVIASAATYTSMVSQNLDAESHYIGYSVGGAYKFNEKVSASVGIRYVKAKGDLDASIVFDAAGVGLANDTAVARYEKEADGWNTILGLNINPTDKLNIGFRYETGAKLDFEYSGVTDNAGALGGITNGTKARRDLPGILALGVSHQCTPQFRVETNVTYYLNKSADWAGGQDNVNNGFDLGVAIEYAINDKLLWSLGYMYTDTAINASDMNDAAPELNADTIGTGVAYEYKPGLKFDFAVGKVFYKKESWTSPLGTVEYDKDILLLAIGAQFKFM